MLGNRKIIGSFLIGFALVAGSYVLTNFGKNRSPEIAATVYTVATATEPREYITVSDANNNGIEDWREEFVPTAPLVLDSNAGTSTPYEIPATLTDQVGIQLFQSVLRAKASGKVGPSQTELIQTTAERLKGSVQDIIYKTADVTIVPSTPEAIRTYANTLAQIITNNDVPDWENELEILNRAVTTNNPEELTKLIPLIEMYKKLRDQTLSTSVPSDLIKQHLDLINVYQALYSNLNDMQLVFSDPIVTLLRIKRYQDDATGLAAAFKNMYSAILPYAAVFQPNDPAVLFATFDSNYQ